MKTFLTLVGALAGIGLAPAFAEPPAKRKAGDVVIEKASLMPPGSQPIPYEVGTLYVPENRSDPKSRLIGVGFARFRVLKPTGAPPTFHLPGGPGSSFVKSLQSNRQPKSLAAYIGLFLPAGDVVFVDQRGYSERGEVLKFKALSPQPLDQPASLERHTAQFIDAARATVAEFAKKEIDLRGYTVKECADDVNDLRKALGYERVSLVGVSFGSQWSFAVIRRHPEIVARALLGGVEPLNCGYDMPAHVLAAIQRQWWEAEKDKGLQPYLPPGGLMAAARTVLQRLEQAPLRVDITEGDNKKSVTITLGPGDFQRQFVTLAANPAALLLLYHERYDAWARAVLAQRRQGQPEMPLIGPLIDTSLGVTPRRERLLRNDPAASLLGHWNFAGYMATADIWPTPDVGDEFRTEVVCNHPVVFVQGDWDTSTPVENLLEVTPYFPRSRVVIAENGGHGALSVILQQRPALAAELADFLKTGSTEKLPARVTLPVPRYAVPAIPPPTPGLRN